MNHVYKHIELTGPSPVSTDDAIRNAIGKAAATLRNLDWFEVVSIRGQIVNGEVKYYQVDMKVGCRVLDTDQLGGG